MCGIIFVKHKRSYANNLVWERYNQQKSRGQEGFGFILINPDEKVSVHRAEEEDEIKKKLHKTQAKDILFHHRFPTSTPNLREATHPILVKHRSFKYDYYVVHNGVITNDDDLKEIHEAQGFVYRTEIQQMYKTKKKTYDFSLQYNDSECLAIEMAQYIEGQKKSIDAEGSIAVIVLQIEKESKKPVALYYGRNTANPLKLKNSRKSMVLSSESVNGTLLPDNILYRMDYKTGETTQQDCKIGKTYSQTSSMGFRGMGGAMYHSDYDMDEEDYDVGYKTSEGVSKISDNIETVDDLADWDAYSMLLEEREELVDSINDAMDEGLGKTNPEMLWEMESDLTMLESQIAKMENELGLKMPNNI